MRQTIAFQATGFNCSPVEVEIDENGEAPDPDALPVALLAFESGPNCVLTLPLATADAENLMTAFTQAEPHRQDIPNAGDWQPMAEDFLADLRGAVAGGAAGWCLHNGGRRAAADGQPRRSLDLRERRLLEQLDDEELSALAGLRDALGPDAPGS